MIEAGMVPRPLPDINEMNRHFWCGGSDGRLRILRCADCGYYIHPYAPVCRRCLSRKVSPQPVSGRATVVSFTINHQPWLPAVPVPYVVALVELAEQRTIRLVTNLLRCAIEDVKAGMAVKVCFQRYGDIYVPLFEPA